MEYSEEDLFLARCVWLMYLFGMRTEMQELYELVDFESFDDFTTHVTSTNGRINNQEVMFLTRVPCAVQMVDNLRTLKTHVEEVTYAAFEALVSTPGTVAA